MKRMWRWLAGIVLAAALVYALIRPSNNRDWTRTRVLPLAFFRGHVDISNVRNIEPGRQTTTRSATTTGRSIWMPSGRWFVVEPFHGLEGPAHTLISFGFDNDVRGDFGRDPEGEGGEVLAAARHSQAIRADVCDRRRARRDQIAIELQEG